MNKISKLLLVILFLTMPGAGFCQPDDIACGHRSRSVTTKYSAEKKFVFSKTAVVLSLKNPKKSMLFQ